MGENDNDTSQKTDPHGRHDDLNVVGESDNDTSHKVDPHGRHDVDGVNSMHGSSAQRVATESAGVWQTVNTVLLASSFHSHYGGANDGVLHLSLTQLTVGVSKGSGTEGWFELANLSVACGGGCYGGT